MGLTVSRVIIHYFSTNLFGTHLVMTDWEILRCTWVILLALPMTTDRYKYRWMYRHVFNWIKWCTIMTIVQLLPSITVIMEGITEHYYDSHLTTACLFIIVAFHMNSMIVIMIWEDVFNDVDRMANIVRMLECHLTFKHEDVFSPMMHSAAAA